MTEPSQQACFALRGNVTLGNLMDFRRQGEAALAAARSPATMDISGLSNGNSAALALLMAWTRAARLQDKEVVFSGVPERLWRIIDLSGVAAVLPLAAPEPADRRPG